MSAEALTRELREELDAAGLRGSFLVRDLDTGDEVGIAPDMEYPTASLVKVPLAVAILERVHNGELDGAAEVLVRPGGDPTSGTPGIDRFRHPARVAIDDLLYLSIALSDGAASDALFEFTTPADVADTMRGLGLGGITVRNMIHDLNETPDQRLDPAETHLAHTLAIEAGTDGRGHRVPQLDATRASSGSARAYVDLLRELWQPSILAPQIAERVQELMASNVLRQRLAPDFSSDASRWCSKTGTLLNLRHEIGVVEHADGQTFAVAALTESRVAASVQPEAEALMARVARLLRDHLRAAG